MLAKKWIYLHLFFEVHNARARRRTDQAKSQRHLVRVRTTAYHSENFAADWHPRAVRAYRREERVAGPTRFILAQKSLGLILGLFFVGFNIYIFNRVYWWRWRKNWAIAIRGIKSRDGRDLALHTFRFYLKNK